MVKEIETVVQTTSECLPISVYVLTLIFSAFVTATMVAESPKSDAGVVAALDTEYQAAVARNDADTMDRILADDFVLVLGNGTVYTKPDLIEEARSKSIEYEQQVEIDNSQKVRVWGDKTAVLPAGVSGADCETVECGLLSDSCRSNGRRISSLLALPSRVVTGNSCARK